MRGSKLIISALTLLILSLLVAASGCGPAAATSHHAAHKQAARVKVRIVPAASTAPNSQSAELQDILAGVNGANVSAELGTSPATFTIPDDAAWLQVNVPSPVTASDPVAGTEPYWAAELVAGAFRDASAENKYPSVDGYSVQAPDNPVPMQSTRIDGTLGEVTVTPASDSTIMDRIRTNATAAGLELESITLLHPLGPAVLVVATTQNAADFAKTGTLGEIFGSITDYDGVLLIVKDSTGPAIVTGAATRIQQGVFWERPDISSSSGLDGGGSQLDLPGSNP
jgi:hypothetical protein